MQTVKSNNSMTTPRVANATTGVAGINEPASVSTARHVKSTVRTLSFDTLRVPAIIAVISIHSGPFLGRQYDSTIYETFAFLINQAARFAVPYFFITAGYFFAKSLLDGATRRNLLAKYSFRLLMVWAVWCIIYDLIPSWSTALEHGYLRATYWNINSDLRRPVSLLTKGTHAHLWFLLALECGLILLTVSWRRPWLGLCLWAMPLYLVGMLAKAYRESPVGLHINFDTTHGPFFSTLFVFIGAMFAIYPPKRCTFRLAWALVLLGFIWQAGESYLLWRSFGSEIYATYNLGTLLFGSSVFLLAASHKSLGQTTILSWLGAYTLGVYVAHYLVLDAVRATGLVRGPLAEVGLPFLVYAITLTIVILASKQPTLKRVFV